MKINWNTTLKNVSFMLLLLQLCVIFGQKKVVVIDAGHGGKDSGAIGVNGILEKDVVLSIAQQILKLNKTVLDSEFDIYLTRYKDTLVSLSNRGRLVKLLKADVVVSLHCNAAKTKAGGMVVFVPHIRTDSANIKKSIGLGVSILNEGTQKLGLQKRGVKFANFQVLRETVAFCPAILVQMGFVTNTDEADYFLRPKNIEAMALAVLMGITNYLKL